MRRPIKKPVTVQVAKDPAVIAVARKVVAGVDKKYHLDSSYRSMVKQCGMEKARELIEGAVSRPGACDVIQTDMGYGGIGLFGGLSKNQKHFKFYEWLGDEYGQLSVSMTAQDARDIVSGRKKKITFRPEPCPARICVDLSKQHKEYASFNAYLKGKERPRESKAFFTKDVNVWSLPRNDEEDLMRKWPRYPDKFQVVIGGKRYHLKVSAVNRTSHMLPEQGGKVHIVLSVAPKMRSELREVLSGDRRWKRQDRRKLLM